MPNVNTYSGSFITTNNSFKIKYYKNIKYSSLNIQINTCSVWLSRCRAPTVSRRGCCRRWCGSERSRGCCCRAWVASRPPCALCCQSTTALIRRCRVRPRSWPVCSRTLFCPVRCLIGCLLLRRSVGGLATSRRSFCPIRWRKEYHLGGSFSQVVILS